MLPGRPCRTLIIAAVRRAAHQLLDAPRIFADPIAIGLIPEASEPSILASLGDHSSRESILSRSLFALRNRFAEDRLAEAVARGVRQYVIVGAGLDTFPWRQPEFARGMRIFAVDHVVTLAWTQVRFWDRGLQKPANLTFVPVDLEVDQLSESLCEYGFEVETASFCSMLGVTQYLGRGAVDATLRFASSLKPGSEMVFTYVLNGENRDGLAQLPGSIAKELGEPWKTFHHPDELVDQLGKLGFTNVFHLTPEHAQRRYFSGRQDQLRAPQWEQLIAAIV